MRGQVQGELRRGAKTLTFPSAMSESCCHSGFVLESSLLMEEGLVLLLAQFMKVSAQETFENPLPHISGLKKEAAPDC